MINKLDRYSYRVRCGICKWLNTATCFECDMRYSKFEPAHKDAEWWFKSGLGEDDFE